MNTSMVRSLAYPPLLTRVRRALAALFIGGMIALVAGGDAGALAAPAAPLPDAADEAAPHLLIAPRESPAAGPRRASLP